MPSSLLALRLLTSSTTITVVITGGKQDQHLVYLEALKRISSVGPKVKKYGRAELYTVHQHRISSECALGLYLK